MKIILLVLFLSLSLGHAQSAIFKGGLISTRGPIPVGGDFVLTLNIDGTFSATSSVDCIVRETFTGQFDGSGHLRGQAGLRPYVITGRVKQLTNGYYVFVGRIIGTGYASGYAYKVQAARGVFP